MPDVRELLVNLVNNNSFDDGLHCMFDKVIIVTQQGIHSLLIHKATFISMNQHLKGRDYKSIMPTMK